MTDAANDPIAQAAAKIQADTAPSSTEPQAPEVAQPGESSATDTASSTPPTESAADTSAIDTTAATADASGSPSTASTSIGGIDAPAVAQVGEPVHSESAAIDSTPTPTTGAAPSVTSESHTSMSMESQGAATSETTAMTSEATGEPPNVIAPLAGAPSSTEPLAPVQLAEPAATAAEDPNAAASPAAESSASATASSAPLASPVDAMPAASDSGARERALQAIGRLRSHFWTFERSAVQHLHAELDFLEGLFK